MDRSPAAPGRHRPHHDPRTAPARLRRDDSLHRVSKLTTRVAVGALARLGALGLYVSRALPGHAGTPTSAGSPSAGATTTPTTTPAVTDPTSPSGSSGGPSGPAATTPATVAPPVTAPAPTQAPVRVRTGAS